MGLSCSDFWANTRWRSLCQERILTLIKEDPLAGKLKSKETGNTSYHYLLQAMLPDSFVVPVLKRLSNQHRPVQRSVTGFRCACQYMLRLKDLIVVEPLQAVVN